MKPPPDKSNDIRLSPEEWRQEMHERFAMHYETPLEWTEKRDTPRDTSEDWKIASSNAQFGIPKDDLIVMDQPAEDLLPRNMLRLVELAGLTMALIKDDKSWFQSERRKENLFRQRFVDYIKSTQENKVEILLTTKLCEAAMKSKANDAERNGYACYLETSWRMGRMQRFMGNKLEESNVSGLQDGKPIQVHNLFLAHTR